MLRECCTQYAGKYGKLSSGHRTGKGPFLFQSQRRAMPNDVQTTAQLCSSHMLEKPREFQENLYFYFIDYAKAFDCVNHNKLWKILQKFRIPDHLTCLLRSLYAGQETTVRAGHGTTNWFQIGKGVCQGCILSPCVLTYIQST